jgi:hypothetical protein
MLLCGIKYSTFHNGFIFITTDIQFVILIIKSINDFSPKKAKGARAKGT